MIGKKIGDYVVKGKLGEGGMGTVYKALQESLNREVAIKVLAPRFTYDEEFVERFDIEAKAVASLIHQNIIQVYSKGVTDDGHHYFAMEYVEGEDLESKAERGVRFSEEEVIDIAIQACMGLESAHKKNYAHRDIKPSNIIITNEGIVKITDFGLAKCLVSTRKLTRTDVYMGSVHYTSPEQGEGSSSLDHRTDIYSLGIVIYQLLTNKLPFDASGAHAVIYQHINQPPIRPRKINPGISARIEAVVLKAIAKKPYNRYQDMVEFRKDLEAVKNTLSGKKGKMPGKGKNKIIAIISVPVILIIGGAVWYFQFQPRPIETEQIIDERQTVHEVGTGSDSEVPIPGLKGEKGLKYDEIRKLIFEATSFSEKSKVEEEVEEFQKNYPDEYGKYKESIENEINGLGKSVSAFNKIAEDIEFVKAISVLGDIKNEIETFKNAYSRFKSIHSVLNDLWVKKSTKLNYVVFKIAKGEIEDAKTEDEVDKYYFGFKDKYPGTEYLDTLKEIKVAQIEDMKSFKEAQFKIFAAINKHDESEIRRTRDKYLKILKLYKYQNRLDDFARDKINIIKKTSEENVLKNTKQKIGNAKTEDEVNNYILGFQKSYPYSKSLFILEDLKKRKLDQLKDIEKQAEARGKILLAFEERNVNKIRDIMDEYLGLLNSYEGKDALEDLAGSKINFIIVEENYFKTIKHNIENSNTKEVVNNYFVDFKSKYPNSKYLLILEGLKKQEVTKLEDAKNLYEAKLKITSAFDERDASKIKNIRDEYLDKLKLTKNKTVLEDFAGGEISIIMVGHEEESARESAEHNIENAKTEVEVNSHILDFQKKHPNSKYLLTLEDIKRQKVIKLKDTKDLNNAKLKITSAFDGFNADKIKVVRDEYLEKLKLPGNINTLKVFAGEKIDIIARRNEEKAFKAAENKIGNAKTEDVVNNIFLDFKNKYVGSEYSKTLEGLKNRKIAKLEDIIILKEAEIKILTAFEKHDINSIRDIRDEYLKILRSSEKRNKLDDFAVDQINKITIIQSNEEEKAYQIAKNNINNAKTVDEVNNYFSDFKNKYSNVDYLNILEFQKNQKAGQIEESKNLKEAEVKILTAFDMRDIKKIQDVMVEYSKILKLSENKNTLEKFAGVQINIITRENEERAFKSAEYNIKNATTEDGLNNHFLKFKNEYGKSANLNILELARVAQLKEIKEATLGLACTTWSTSDVREMVSTRNYFNRNLNPTGNYANDYEEKGIGGDNVVIDHATRLMWHQSGSWKKKWGKVKGWIEDLNEKKYAGYNDWRLPTLEEAASLLETVEGAETLKEIRSKRNKQGETYKLFIDPVFSKDQKSIWTCDNSNFNKAYIVCFDLGYSGQCVLDEHNYIRPVRSDK